MARWLPPPERPHITKRKSSRQLWLLQTQGSFLRLEVTTLERPTFFKLPGTEWPRACLFKGQPSPAVFGELPRAQAYSRPLSAATAAGRAVSSTVSLQRRGCNDRARGRAGERRKTQRLAASPLPAAPTGGSAVGAGLHGVNSLTADPWKHPPSL